MSNLSRCLLSICVLLFICHILRSNRVFFYIDSINYVFTMHFNCHQESICQRAGLRTGWWTVLFAASELPRCDRELVGHHGSGDYTGIDPVKHLTLTIYLQIHISHQ